MVTSIVVEVICWGAILSGVMPLDEHSLTVFFISQATCFLWRRSSSPLAPTTTTGTIPARPPRKVMTSKDLPQMELTSEDSWLRGGPANCLSAGDA